ncbi:hypothetical protein ASD18_09320 [Cellulomonas sp. Root137]|nr:hypothetical protein ASD18_09320 [Cellulomonas sp. Root137]
MTAGARTRRGWRATGLVGAVAIALVATVSFLPTAAGAEPVASDPTGTEPASRSGIPRVAEPGATPPVSDQVLVRFVDGVPKAQGRAALSAAGVSAEDQVGTTGFVAVPVGDEDPQELAAELAADPRVADVQVDHVRSTAVWPNDHLVQAVTWPYLDLVRLPRAWDVSRGTGTVIAVLDTGIRASHEDLAGRVIVPGYNAIDGSSDVDDDQGHGTLVAGIAAARGNNGVGLAGAAWDASVLPVKVLDENGYGFDSDVAEGITWAADHGATVINMSLAGPDTSPAILAAMQYAVAKKVVVVAAAGNDGSSVPHYPAAYAAEVPGVLSVAATDDYGTRAGFSNWGDSISLAAPGVDVVGASAALDTWYSLGTGTSMASPLVAGAAALLRQAKPGWTAAQVADALVASARDAGPRGRDPYYGAGVLDVSAAFGQTPGIPLDRAVGDEGPSDDDVPARARVLPAADAVAYTNGSIGTDGDADWWTSQVSTAGFRLFRLTSRDYSPMELDVFDSELRWLGGAQTDPSSGNAEASVPVAAPGGVFVRVRASDGAVGGFYKLDDPYGTSSRGPLLTVENARSASAATSTQVAVGDLVAGGALDGVAAVSDGQGGTISVVAGDPATTGAAASVAGPLLTDSLVVADVLPGGADEVVVATPSGLRAWSWSDGGLVAAAAVLSTDVATAVRAVDVEGDGDDDLVLTTAGETVLLRRDGASLARVVLVPRTMRPLAVGDVSGDGRADLVGGDPAGAASLEVVRQQADGTFGVPALVATSRAPGVLSVADADGDLDGDVLVGDGPGGYRGVVVHLQGADHTLGGAAFQAGVANQATPAAFDVDADGDVEIVGGRSGFVELVERTTPTSFDYAYQFRLTGDCDGVPPDLAVGDLTGDGRADVLASCPDGSVDVLRNRYTTEPVGPALWVEDGPQTQQSGVPVRPLVAIRSGHDLPAGAATATTVRLVDGVTGAAVPATRTTNASTDTLTITPSADLVVGRHYHVRVAGLTDVDGAVQDDVYRAYFTVGASGDRFTPVEPFRVLDTRNGTGVDAGAVVPWEPIDLPLGGYAVPETATAVVLNVTAVSPAGPGNVRVFPTPATTGALPTVSNLNLLQYVDQPNLVTVKLGAGGSVRFATDGAVSHLVADIAGYYSPGGATAFVPVSPVRVMDMRNGTGGVPTGRLPADHYVDLVVTGVNGVPADASAVVLNVTGVAPGGRTNVRVYPRPAASEPQAPPSVSNLNLSGGRDQPNLVTVQVGEGGKVRFYTQSSDLWLIADLAGYYSPTGRQGFTAVDPARIADTRSGFGLPSTLRAGVTADLTVTGKAGVPAGATAVVLNVTAAAPRGTSNIRVFPTSTGAPPLISNLNVVRGRDEPNLAVVRTGTTGKVSFYTQSADTDLVVDVQGYFTQ